MAGNSKEVDTEDIEKSEETKHRDGSIVSETENDTHSIASSQRANGKRRTTRTSDEVPVYTVDDSGKVVRTMASIPRPRVRKRRTRIPDRPECPMNLWKLLRTFIGKELTKIPMPVNFSEPLSMLQRLAEDFEYAEILDKAASCESSCEQLAYVAAFTVSSYATTRLRTTKPFNPLLGETFEFDRTDDLGWRVITEQVSHHPPVAAQYCEGRSWKCWQEFKVSTNFRGKYVTVEPMGVAHLLFHSGAHYTWRKVTTTVNNIILGKLWIDHYGDMNIVNHRNGEQCSLSYIPQSFFNRELPRKVEGYVMDGEGTIRWLVKGNWDLKMEIGEVVHEDISRASNIFQVEQMKSVWEVRPPEAGSEKYYSFSILACQLNEPEDGVAPTDSRYRPDQRLMENGEWDEANKIKIILEENQRDRKKELTKRISSARSLGETVPDYEPVWFKKEVEPVTGELLYLYQGEYWECKKLNDWSKCPDIYSYD